MRPGSCGDASTGVDVTCSYISCRWGSSCFVRLPQGQCGCVASFMLCSCCVPCIWIYASSSKLVMPQNSHAVAIFSL